ncbi:apolipoprotein N-acyltransferase [bacterium]|nr:apolipoprotein N-acyltransferase [bacterium]
MLSRRGFLIAAILGALAFPPVSLWPLAYVALVPFLIAAADMSSARKFGSAWRGGVVFYGGVLYWVGLNSGAPWWVSAIAGVALICVLATIWGLAAIAVKWAADRLSVAAAALFFVVAYQGLETFWGTGELSFPWATWALPLSAFLPAVQIAEWVDVQGLAFQVLCVNALFFLAWHHRRLLFVWLALTAILVPISIGYFRLNYVASGEPIIKAASVQANTPAESKWQMSSADILSDHVEITDGLGGRGVDFVCWPETAVPMPIRFRGWAADTIRNVVKRNNVVLLTGATDYDVSPDGQQIPYNAAFAIRPDSLALQRSSKIHLVPFGERIPGQNWFPILGNLHLGQAEFKPGDSVVVFSGGKVPPFACLICFEVVYPEIAAEAVLKGAQFFGHVTNDGWYGHSSGPYQHLSLARLRAVATHRSIVRAANTGISAIILPNGRIVESLGFDTAGAIFGEIPARQDITIAVRFAKLWPLLYYGLFAVVFAGLWMRAQRYGTTESG